MLEEIKVPSPLEIALILGIVLLIFGGKKLRTLGTDLGQAIKGFRSSMTDEQKTADDPDPQKAEAEQANSKATE